MLKAQNMPLIPVIRTVGKMFDFLRWFENRLQEFGVNDHNCTNWLCLHCDLPGQLHRAKHYQVRKILYLEVRCGKHRTPFTVNAVLNLTERTGNNSHRVGSRSRGLSLKILLYTDCVIVSDCLGFCMILSRFLPTYRRFRHKIAGLSPFSVHRLFTWGTPCSR